MFHGDEFNKNQTIFIYGFGKTGRSILQFFEEKYPKLKIVIGDDNSAMKSENLGYNSIFLDKNAFIERLKNDGTILFVSPGIPNDSDIMKVALILGIEIKSDIDLFYEYIESILEARNNKQKILYFGITGTNGKSTTTYLTYYLIQKIYSKFYNNFETDNSRYVIMGGNIGTPVLTLVDDVVALLKERSDKTNLLPISIILELSSYQIDLIKNAKLDFAACINIEEHHLERYKSLENYAKSKAKIFTLLKNSDKHDSISVTSLDHKETRKIYEKLIESFNTKIFGFSVERHIQSGISILTDNSERILHVNGLKDTFNIDNEDIEIAELLPLSLAGTHNLENLCVALYACIMVKRYCEFKLKDLLQELRGFPGLKHRNEIVGTVNNVTFVNNSKATNPTSSLKSLLSFSNIYWIAGGYESSDINIEILGEAKHNIRKAYLVGKSSDTLKKFCIANSIEYTISNTLENALLEINKDLSILKKTDSATVVLAPAYPSYDQWNNFEERGDYFRKRVHELWM